MKRPPTHAELVQAALAGQPYGASRFSVEVKTRKLMGIKNKPKVKANGNCWNKYGIANGDLRSPVWESIRNQKLKMELRKEEK